MNRETAEALAETRESACVLVRQTDGRTSWLLPKKSTTLEVLAQCLATDEWEEYLGGNVLVADATGAALVDDASVIYEWATVPQPIQFSRYAWSVVVVSGMNRGLVVSQHQNMRSADRAAERRKHEATRVMWLPIGSRGKEVDLWR